MSCEVYDYCKGRAKKSIGYYPIGDFINKIQQFKVDREAIALYNQYMITENDFDFFWSRIVNFFKNIFCKGKIK